MRRETLLILVGLLVLEGCAGALGPPLEAFHDGRLPEAARDFRELEPTLGELSPRERARYALYRGLTHLGLGDAESADRWLSLAKCLERADPGLYDRTERGELYAGWRSLGRPAGDP